MHSFFPFIFVAMRTCSMLCRFLPTCENGGLISLEKQRMVDSVLCLKRLDFTFFFLADEKCVSFIIKTELRTEYFCIKQTDTSVVWVDDDIHYPNINILPHTNAHTHCKVTVYCSWLPWKRQISEWGTKSDNKSAQMSHHTRGRTDAHTRLNTRRWNKKWTCHQADDCQNEKFEFEQFTVAAHEQHPRVLQASYVSRRAQYTHTHACQ